MLPINLPLERMQTEWKSQIDPVLSNKLNDVQILESVVLQIGANVINHRLGRVQQGWFLTDIQGGAQIYRSAPFNKLTLTLTSNAVVTVNIGVF